MQMFAQAFLSFARLALAQALAEGSTPSYDAFLPRLQERGKKDLQRSAPILWQLALLQLVFSPVARHLYPELGASSRVRETRLRSTRLILRERLDGTFFRSSLSDDKWSQFFPF